MGNEDNFQNNFIKLMEIYDGENPGENFPFFEKLVYMGRYLHQRTPHS